MGIKEELSKYGKLLHVKDLVIGSGGNISARGSNEKTVFIKKKGFNMSSDLQDGFVEVILSEKGIEEKKDLISSEYPMHFAVYEARKDIRAIIHTHSPYAVAAADKTVVLQKISYEFEYLLINPVPVIEYIEPGSKDLAQAVSGEIKKGVNAVLLKKHGVLSVGNTIEEAFLRALAVERAAIVFLNS